jgi:uncharacterized membrane protein
VVEEQHDYQRAAGAYLVWPLALAAIIQESPTASRWSRIHARQALAFGVVAGLGYLVLMALPLIAIVADPAISTGATVLVYAVGLGLDAIVFVALAILAFSYAARAGRGELFTIPLISPLADRLFTIRRS